MQVTKFFSKVICLLLCIHFSSLSFAKSGIVFEPLSSASKQTGLTYQTKNGDIKISSYSQASYTNDNRIATEAVQYNSSSPGKGKVVVYVNGMFTGLDVVRKNLSAIQKAFYAKGYSFVHAYNYPEYWLEQIAQVGTQYIKQHRNLSDKKSWSHHVYSLFSGDSTATAIQSYLAAEFAKMNEYNYVNDADLRTHIDNIYLPHLNAKRKVVILSHSQGNFYANRAYETISRMSNGVTLTNALGVVGIATPANYVAGGGYHTTNTKDLIISGIRALSLPGREPEPANASAPFTSSDWLGHSVADTYLSSRPEAVGIKNKILNQVETTFNNLTVYNPPECRDYVMADGGNSTDFYSVGYQFSGKLKVHFEAFGARNKYTITNSRGQVKSALTSFISGTRKHSFDYNERVDGTLKIQVFAESAGDAWVMRVDCP